VQTEEMPRRVSGRGSQSALDVTIAKLELGIGEMQEQLVLLKQIKAEKEEGWKYREYWDGSYGSCI
jgi:hypothetical protein